jgi:hypothetical protein
LAITPDGAIHILDSVNRRVLRLNRTGSFQGQMTIASSYARDLLITDDGRTLALDTEAVHEHALDGALLRRIPIAKSVSGSLSGLARGMGDEVVAEVEASSRLLLTDGGQPIPPDAQGAAQYRREGQSAKGSTRTFIARSPGNVAHRSEVVDVVGPSGVERRLSVQVATDLGSVQVLGVDATGTTYLLITELLGDKVDCTIRRYTPDGTPGTVARVPIAGSYMAPARHTVLGPDGQVYSLVVLSDRAHVVRLGFVDRIPSLAASLRKVLTAALEPISAPSAAAAVDRPRAMTTANQYYNKTWYCTYDNWDTCDDSWRPSFMNNGGSDRDYYEVPYCWGGWHSVGGFDSHRWANQTCGDIHTNTCCKRGCTGGVDCSGFVQNCWWHTAQKYSDAQLVDFFCTPSFDPGERGMLQGDVYDWRTHHIRMFHSYTSTGAYVYESAVANQDRVWWRHYSWTDLSQGGNYTRHRWAS